MLKKIKAMSCKKILILILVLLPFNRLLPQGASESRSFIRSFPTTKESVLEVNNKYGTIEITTWQKDSVFIRAEIKASASNQSKLNKMFDEISVKISGTGNLLLAQTVFNQSINAFFENFKGMTNKVINYESQVEINYYINVPEYMNLRVENRYGDVFMEKNSGNFELTLSNGSLKADVPGRKCSLNLSFCDATITSFLSGSINASFSDITISDIKRVKIKTISSKYRINKAGEIEIESRRDDLFIDNIGNLEGDSYFTDFEVRSLTGSLNLVSRYGNLNFENIAPQFESVNINSGFSDVSLEFDPDASYRFEIRTANTFLVLPPGLKTDERTLDESKKEYMKTGAAGQNPGERLLKIDASRGKIYVR
ncbi:MAG: hypothetical protein A2X05_08615 [Bacteroidetes bacterium GWE2_41_25]|nr:MAG: hypothetical protein A2X06_06225 [Bacteroidetes bacterium GWC2_40_22]OFY05057.1 MAG: hypothetical protein A2X05_08615 [Bacteroidetes bacterium GWE2_41_25]HBH85631.1 hypothetical protein [Bacteroidales bacterium]HCU19788.1 hypothetical protein [Bacteroidales bacterium]